MFPSSSSRPWFSMIGVRQNRHLKRAAGRRHGLGTDGADDSGFSRLRWGTISVLFSIPISCLAAFLLLNTLGSSINTMVLGGLALVLSRLIDNSVVVLENIFRHLEEGEDATTAAVHGGKEIQLAVLAATFTTAIVFFPVVFLNRCQPVPIYRTGFGRRAFSCGVLSGRNVGRAAVLFALYSVGARQRSARRREPGMAPACAGAVQPRLRLRVA